jgi:hypothetical protein
MFKFVGDLVCGSVSGGDKMLPAIPIRSATKGTRRTSLRKICLNHS